MKKLLRKCLQLGLALFLLGAIGVIALSLLARKYVSPEELVRLAEGELNSRVHIGSAELSLFRFPATITLREVGLAPRDQEVGKPLSERAPFPSGAPVQLEEARLSVSLLALLRQRVEVSEFFFEKPSFEIVLREDGGNSLEDLLKKPGDRKEDGQGSDKKKAESLNSNSLNVHAHGFFARLQGVGFAQGSLDLTIEKTGLRIRARNLTALLDDIDIDPAAIEETNSARLHLAAQVELESAKHSVIYASLGLEGPAEVQLFDPVSGDLDLDLVADLKLSDSSYLNAAIPAVQSAWSTLKALEAVGIRVGDLPERATFGRSKSVTVHFHRERFTIQKPISVWYGDWELAILEKTWVQADQSLHAGELELVAEERLSSKLRTQIGKGVSGVPKGYREILIDEMDKVWFREKRLLARIGTEGELSNPDVDLHNKLPDYRSLLKRSGEKFLKEKAGDLLDNILGNP